MVVGVVLGDKEFEAMVPTADRCAFGSVYGAVQVPG